MYKRIALTAIIALTALTGCGGQADTPAEPVAQTTQDAETTTEQTTANTEAETANLVWEFQDPDTWTKYTLDFNTYSDDLTDRTDAALEAAGADPVTWATATIDNTEGRDTGTLTWAEIVLVDDQGDQYYPTADVDETVDIETEEYQDRMLDENADEYSKMVDLYNDWLDVNQSAVPGAKADNVLMVTDMPDTIDKVFVNNIEATPVK